MGMHLAHNIRILKIKSKKKILRPDLAPLNLLFYQCLLQQVGVAPSWPYLALVEYRTKWIRIKWGPGVV